MIYKKCNMCINHRVKCLLLGMFALKKYLETNKNINVCCMLYVCCMFWNCFWFCLFDPHLLSKFESIFMTDFFVNVLFICSFTNEIIKTWTACLRFRMGFVRRLSQGEPITNKLHYYESDKYHRIRHFGTGWFSDLVYKH